MSFVIAQMSYWSRNALQRCYGAHPGMSPIIVNVGSNAAARVKFESGSPPPSRAATAIARASLVNNWPRFASVAAFLCLIDAH